MMATTANRPEQTQIWLYSDTFTDVELKFDVVAARGVTLHQSTLRY